MSKLTGVITAIVTPFKNGKFDKKSYLRLLHAQMNDGIRGFVVGGTTGESPTLDPKEIKTLFDITRVEGGRDVTVIVGTGSNSTKETCDFSKEVSRWKPDALLVIVPYFNKPTQAGLEAHFTKVADASKAPVLMYNAPSRTVVSIDAATVGKLSKHKNIVGIKEATGNLDLFKAMKKASRKGFLFLSGDDGTAVEFAAAGGEGLISVCSHVMGKEMIDMMSRKATAEFKEYYSHLMKWLYIETNPIAVKAALHFMGVIDSMELRLPMTELDRKYHKDLKACLKSLRKI